MESALRLGLPIIGVNLNGARQRDEFCPPTIRDELVIYVPFSPKIIEYAMDQWPDDYKVKKRAGKTGPFVYSDPVYKRFGL